MSHEEKGQARTQDGTASQDQQQAAAKALHANDETHAANLVFLERALRYVEGNMPLYSEHMLLSFAKAETTRLRERAGILVRFQIERAPSPHRDRQQELMQQISTTIARKCEVQE